MFFLSAIFLPVVLTARLSRLFGPAFVALPIILTASGTCPSGSQKIAPEDQGGGSLAAACGIIVGSARNPAKPGTMVKAERRVIVFVHLQKNRACTEACQPAQVQMKELPREPPAALAVGNCNREDFRLIFDNP